MAKRTKFTREEIVLCIYAARYDIADIGGIDAIHSLESRSRSSIRMKIQNIVAMCDEAGISRNPDQHALTGLPAGEKGRRTNWDELSQYSGVSQEGHLLECQRIVERCFSWPGELITTEEYREGSKRQVTVNAYERDPGAREKCIQHYGNTCVVCGLNFLTTYGSEADGFIHVHHMTPLSEIRAEYTVDPIKDLRPVCPNCHAVIHLGGVTRSIDEVRAMLRNTNSSHNRE
jgi:predicted HNH restriction endonuclease